MTTTPNPRPATILILQGCMGLESCIMHRRLTHVKNPPAPPEVEIWASSEIAIRSEETEGTALATLGSLRVGTGAPLAFVN